MTKIELLLQEIKENANTDKIQSTLDSITKHPHAKYLCLYGAGMVGIHTYHTLAENGIHADYFVVSDDSADVGKKINGKPVLSLSEISGIKDNVLVLIANGDAYKCWCLLKERGFKYISHIPNMFYWYLPTIKKLNIDTLMSDLNKLCGILSDEYSCITVLTWLNELLKIDINFEHIYKVYEPDQYFPLDILSFSKGENIVDAGAFTGDSVDQFTRMIPDYGKIFSIEMDKVNYNSLLKNIKKYRDIYCYNVGLSDKNGEAVYFEDDCSSRFETKDDNSQTNRISVETTTLDSLLKDEQIDFIKMDIEGAEPDALMGSKEIIRKFKPKCAICVYHDPLHIFEVPFLLKQFVPEYKVYFRHHTQLLYELVCYVTL